MSVLEFIAAWKWPVVVLVALAVVSRGFKRNPDMGAWFRRWLDNRDVRGKIGPTEFEATASGARAAAQIAAASDDELAALATSAQSDGREVPQEATAADVESLRRNAVEEVMREAAAWGWRMAKAGYAELPRSRVRWSEDGIPEIVTAPSVKDVAGRLLMQLERDGKVPPMDQLLADMKLRSQERQRLASQDGDGE